MDVSSFDAIVIGTGQAGPPLAVRMAKRGWKVAVLERQRFGGTCVNYGCIPTKTLVASARAAHVARRAEDFGVLLQGGVRVDMARVHARMREVAGQSERGVESWLRGQPGIEVILGHGRFVAPRTVEVGTASGSRRLKAPRVFLDVGGRAMVPDLPGLSEVPFLTNSEMLDLAELPDHLIIVGGSYIGLEFAQMFRRFGASVTVIERGGHLLSREDADVAEEVRRILAAEGIEFRFSGKPERVARRGSGLELVLSSGEAIAGSHLLLATGRRPNTDDLGLDEAGVRVDARGYVEVDEQLRTSAEGVWALGDCNGKGAFTHTSYNDYEIVGDNLLEGAARKVSDRIPAYAVYVDPPLGRVGFSEAEVRARQKPALVAKMPMTRVGRARERGETEGFMKVHVDAESKLILGAAYLGIEADEVVQMLLPLMMARQPYSILTHTMFVHPTVSELVPTMLEEYLKPLV